MTLVIIDFNQTLYDPEADELMPGAVELLQELNARRAACVLVSRLAGNHGDLLERFNIREYFDDVVFVSSSKTGELFKQIMEKHGAKPEETFVIGDHLQQEIRAGNEAGAHTIYFKQSAFASLPSQTTNDLPEVTIGDLGDALEVIQ